MMRSEVDVDRALWNLPKPRTKNGQPHTVPLARQALAIVVKAIGDDDSDEDFPLFSRIGTPIESNAVAKAVRRICRSSTGIGARTTQGGPCHARRRGSAHRAAHHRGGAQPSERLQGRRGRHLQPGQAPRPRSGAPRHVGRASAAIVNSAEPVVVPMKRKAQP